MTHGKWIWKYRDFEFLQARRCLLSREERGAVVPAFFEIPTTAHSVRFRTKVTLDAPTEIRVAAEQTVSVVLDGVRLSAADCYAIPAGSHRLEVVVGNETGICALRVDGDVIHSDENWEADDYSNRFGRVGTSPLIGAESPNTYRLPERPVQPAADERTADDRVLDFGCDGMMHIALEHVTGNGRIFYGESREELYSDRCVIVDSFGPAARIDFRPRGCRYIRLTGAADCAVTAYESYLPVHDRSSFAADAPWQSIYDVSKKTLALCTRMFYLDGIKRDHWYWAGDAYITALMDYYSLGNFEAVKRTLIALRGNESVRMPTNNIPGYSFYYLMMLHDYYMYSGDADFIARNYDFARSALALFDPMIDDTGFLAHSGRQNDWWWFIDWHDLEIGTYNCVMQLLYRQALASMGVLAHACGRADDAARYDAQAAHLTAQINRCFWDATQGAYVSALDAALRPSQQVRRHQNLLAICFGVADDARMRRIVDTVIDNDRIPQITTPFFRFFQYDAMFRMGRASEALDGIHAYWGGMLALGATTVWEEFDPHMTGTAHYAMYGEPFDKSLCHAWGAGPLYFIGRHLAGIRPETPGCRTYTVTPITDAIDFDVTVPAGDGTIRVRTAGGRVTVCATIAGGVLSVGGRSYPIAAGTELTV